MANKALFAVALLGLLACALAQTADDARELGEPGSNYCSPLCEAAAAKNANLAKLVDFCKSECRKCVTDVSKTQQGKGEALPASCKTAYNFKEINEVIQDYRAGKIKGNKGP